MDTLRQSGSEVIRFEFVFLLWFHIFESWSRYEAHSFTLTVMTHHVFYVLSLFLCFSLLHSLLLTVAFTRDLLCMCNLYICISFLSDSTTVVVILSQLYDVVVTINLLTGHDVHIRSCIALFKWV
jgi:hypothetical protein